MRPISQLIPIILFGVQLFDYYFCKGAWCVVWKTHKYSAAMLFIATLIASKKISMTVKLIVVIIEFIAIKHFTNETTKNLTKEATFYDYLPNCLSLLSLVFDFYRNYPKRLLRICNGNVMKIHSMEENNPDKIALEIACEMTSRECVWSNGIMEENRNGCIWKENRSGCACKENRSGCECKVGDVVFDHVALDGNHSDSIVPRIFLSLLSNTKFAPDITKIESVEDWLPHLQGPLDPRAFLDRLEIMLPEIPEETTGFARRLFDRIKPGGCCYINCFCCIHVDPTTIDAAPTPPRPFLLGSQISSVDILAAIKLHMALESCQTSPFANNNYQKSQLWFNKIKAAKVAYANGFPDVQDFGGKRKTLAEMLPVPSFTRFNPQSSPPNVNLPPITLPQQHHGQLSSLHLQTMHHTQSGDLYVDAPGSTFPLTTQKQARGNKKGHSSNDQMEDFELKEMTSSHRPQAGSNVAGNLSHAQCTQCGEYVTTIYASQLSHMNTKHFHLAIYQCQICKRQFEALDNSMAIMHINMRHGKSKEEADSFIVDRRDQCLKQLNENYRKYFT